MLAARAEQIEEHGSKQDRPPQSGSENHDTSGPWPQNRFMADAVTVVVSAAPTAQIRYRPPCFRKEDIAAVSEFLETRLPETLSHPLAEREWAVYLWAQAKALGVNPPTLGISPHFDLSVEARPLDRPS